MDTKETKKYTGIILAAIMVASVFAMAMPGIVSALPQGATVTAGTEERATVVSPGNDTTEGGNLTQVDLDVDSMTERWAGYYGNVTGNISLGDGTDDIYQWTWTPYDEGEVIASTAGSGISWDALENGAATDVDTQWGFSSGSDQAEDAFADFTTFTIGDQTMTDCPAEDTNGAGAFKTAIVKDNTTVTAKTDLLFVCPIDNDGATFNNEVHDFEMIVPTKDAIDQTEQYYFYVELV